MRQPIPNEPSFVVDSAHRARLLELEIEHLGRQQADAIERLHQLKTAAQMPQKPA
jgi:hypothetical protein